MFTSYSIGRKLIQALCRFAADRDTERAQLAKLNLVAVKQLLHQAFAHVAQYALHRATAIYAVVVSNMLGKLTNRPDLVYLVLGISLSRFLWLQVIGHHINTIVNHKMPIAGMGLGVYAFSHDARQKLYIVS